MRILLYPMYFLRLQSHSVFVTDCGLRIYVEMKRNLANDAIWPRPAIYRRLEMCSVWILKLSRIIIIIALILRGTSPLKSLGMVADWLELRVWVRFSSKAVTPLNSGAI